MKLFSKWIAVLCAIFLMISLFAVPAFATEAGEGNGGVVDGAGSGSVGDEFGDEGEGDGSEGDDSEGDGSEGDGEEGDEGEEEEGDKNPAPTTPAPKKLTHQQIAWIAVGGGALVIAVILCIVFRAKLVKGLRVYKSEFKKVSWLSWEQTRKSTLIVLVVLVACALVICLMDFGLGKGIRWLILEVFKAPTGK